MPIPTEPIGSIPRPAELLAAMRDRAAGRISDEQLGAAQEAALRDTIERLEETGSPMITDGEQTKPSFATYPLVGIANLASDGVTILFADGHTRQLPRLTKGPFRYGVHAVQYLRAAQKYARRPVKQAVISASALSLLYPQGGLEGYSREAFLADLVQEAAADIRECLAANAACVQIDFTEARLSLKLDPAGGLLNSFVALNNRVLGEFSETERRRIGVHTCPGGDRDSTHSADVDYVNLLPALFNLRVGRFYVQLASEKDRPRVLAKLRDLLKPDQILFVGVTDPINPQVESAQMVRDRVLEAAEYIPLESFGTTDDCGFSPFADDTSTSRETAFAKIKNRVEGTALAEIELGKSSQVA
ncbi:MAG TPA: cobalamin-independent methionine synthase II family protein [Candidatus Sulfotelmatobacter sp.]|nr:cobalamin-independent methionine synthase II family protein [Candidatus Sulfotelmatobacter sp.]